MLNNFMEKEIDIEFCIKGNFNTVVDLSYTLIDLQSILSGFLYVSRVYEVPYILENQELFVDSVAESKSERVAEEVIHKIQNKFPEINKQLKDELKMEIDKSLSYALDNNVKVASKREGYIATTSRRFAQKYKESLKLRSFKSGSIVLGITSAVIAGLLLEFVKRLVFKETKNNEVININFIDKIVIIDKNKIETNENKSLDKYIRINENSSDKYANIDPKEYIDDIISKVEYEANNYEKNVMNFLQVLHNEGIIEKEIVYNKNGIKTIAKDIKRFTGRFLDTLI